MEHRSCRTRWHRSPPCPPNPPTAPLEAIVQFVRVIEAALKIPPPVLRIRPDRSRRCCRAAHRQSHSDYCRLPLPFAPLTPTARLFATTTEVSVTWPPEFRSPPPSAARPC